MSLDRILLGLLREPATGYELKGHFDRGINFFWTADQSQIYRTLKKLAKDDLIRVRELPPEKGPQRQCYKLTAKGRRELRRWLLKEPSIGESRFSYLAQLYFLNELDDLQETLEYMRNLKPEMQRRLDALRQLERRDAEQFEHYPDDLADAGLHRYMTRRLGLKNTQARVDWCDECIAIIESRILARSNGAAKQTPRTKRTSQRSKTR